MTARHTLGKTCKRCGADAWYLRGPEREISQCAPCNQRWQKAQRDDPIRGPAKRAAHQKYLRTYRARPEYREQMKRYREHSREGRDTHYRTHVRFATYGLTMDQFHAMFEAQGERCKICGRVMAQICVDHDHVTRHIRGLLCNPCNRGLGQFGDDVTVLRRAAAYLETA